MRGLRCSTPTGRDAVYRIFRFDEEASSLAIAPLPVELAVEGADTLGLREVATDRFDALAYRIVQYCTLEGCRQITRLE